MEKEECKEMDAGEVYVLMKEEYRISRNIRASWFFGNLNKFITIRNPDELLESSEELEVLSVMPKVRTQQPHPYSPGCQCKFRLVPSTHVTFLARRYRFVIVLDLSPSMATVDIQSSKISLLDIYACLEKCLRGLTRPFCVPGSRLVLTPKLYVTVIAYTPLAALTTQQVMVQGCLLTTNNLDAFLEKLQEQLDDYENKIVNSMFAEQPEDEQDRTAIVPHHSGQNVKAEHQTEQHKAVEPEIASPEAGFVNMLWCGILALQLLPENSSAGIIVVTDGVTAMPDAATTNTLLAQMRSSTIACSFLQVGKGFHPHCSFGYIPHTEIMQFIATATFGAFLSKCPDVEISMSNSMNQYHKAFLSWHFQKGLDGMKIDYIKRHQHRVISSETGWSSEGIQPSFTVNKHGTCTIPLITKKHMDVTLHASLASVLSVRLREGYTIKDVNLTKNETHIEVKLALPWKYNGRIEYKATALWPLNHNSRITVVEVIMEGSYEFLHDVTCPQRGPQNTYRAKVVRIFWHTLKSLRDTDQLLVHLQSFATNPIYYTVPEGTRKGMPLFYMPPNSDTPVLAQKLDKKDSTVEQFAEFWKRITLMDSKRWQRWLHTHRLALLLVPDLPLPKYLYLPSSNGRYNSIQCRMALKELNSILRDISTFILLENHSYITLMSEDPKGPPTSFYLVRVTSKAPGVVLRLGFLGGTPGHVRNKIVRELRQKLEALTIVQKLSHLQESGFILRLTSRKPQQSQQQAITSRPCVVLLSRPMDMILVKYEKMPADFTDLKTSIQVTVASVPVYMDNHGPVKTLNRLACYLHHQRWIWDAQSDNNTPISAQAVANVLSVLTKIRLQEGFHFAYSNSGIISFVTELSMKNPMQLSVSDKEEEDINKKQEVFPCFVQYILFPPHTTTFVRERLTGSISDHWGSDLIDDSDTAEADGRLQLVTECWIEPQSGTVFDLPPGQQHFLSASYKEIPSLMYPIDHEVIATLLTYEHLKAHCSGIAYSNSPLNALRASPSKVANLQFSESIGHIPFQLDLMKLVSKSQQVEVLCSTFIDMAEDTLENPQQPVEGRQSSHPKPNDTLFCLLLDSLKNMTNHEVLLTPEESMEFAKAVLARDRADHVAPFVLTDKRLQEMSEFVKQQNLPKEDADSQLDDSHSSFNPESSSYKFENRQESPIPQWTCYVHNVETASSQLILTFIPATYRDLQKLMFEESEAEKSAEEYADDKDKRECSNIKDSEGQESGAAKPMETSTPEGQDENITEQDGVPDQGAANKSANVQDENLTEKSSPCDSELKKRNANPLILPIYIYDCSMAGLKTYLLDPNPQIKFKDIFDDKTFSHSEKTCSDGRSGRGSFARQNSRTQSTSVHHEVSKTSSQVPDGQDGQKAPVCSKGLERFHNSLVYVIQKSFGLGIFTCLQRNQPINSHDIQSAMEEICEEANYEIDITEFVLSVCEHIRECGQNVAVDKDVVGEKLDSEVLTSTEPCAASDEVDVKNREDEIDLKDKDEHIETPEDEESHQLSFSSNKKKKTSIAIPLASLICKGKCDATSGLHQLIQQHFQDIVGKHFKPIPTNKDFWYYSLEMEDEAAHQPVNVCDKDAGTAAAESDSNVELAAVQPRKVSTDYQHLSEEELDAYSDEEDTWKTDNKINSVVDVYQKVTSDNDVYSGSEGGGTSNESVMGSVDEPATNPLFIHLVCEIKLKTNVEYQSVQTIPTCLNGLISCLQHTPEEVLHLSELSVTLDIMSLTLPPDISDVDNMDAMNTERTREVSLTEQSPPVSPSPAEDPFAQSLTSARTVSTSDMDYTNPTITDALDELPELQKKAIRETADEIKWLLKDEIASAKCHDFPPSVETLEMVAEHVKQSLGKPSCIAQQVKLEFVFGAEQSLEKFQEQFEQLEIPSYQLNKVGDYYHLMIDQVHRNTSMPDQESLQSALKSLGQREPHRLLQDRSEVIVPSQTSSKSSTMVICTPPSPVKEAKHEGTPTEEDTTKDFASNTKMNQSDEMLPGEKAISAEKLPAEADESNANDAVTCSDERLGELKDKNAQGIEQKDESSLPQTPQVVEDNTVLRQANEPKSDDETRSSGSSIQILSEDHFGDGKPEVAEDVAHICSTAQVSADESVVKEDPKVPESGESSLRRNSASFIVLSNEAQVKEEKGEQSPDSAEEAVETISSNEAGSNEKVSDDLPGSNKIQSKDVSLSPSAPGTTDTRPARSTSLSSGPDVPLTEGATPVRKSSSDAPVFKSDNELTATTTPKPDSSDGEAAMQKTKHRHISGVSARSSASGPPSSQISYTSLNGSFNEYDDGYEASSSDNEADECCDVIAPSLLKKQHGMPEFWLIMRVDSDKVNVFFHARDRGNHDQDFLDNKEVYNRVTENIRNICRQVNQRLLLQDLHETRTCKSLLVAESDEDIWKSENPSKGRMYRHSSEYEGDETDQEPKDYLAAAMDFNPGHFACDEIWYTLLPVHSRLKSSHRGGTASRGLQSVKTTLSTFGVTNRKNMFVYKGNSGEVFYLRLSESTILNYDSSRHGSMTDTCKLTGDLSHATSVQSLNTTTGSTVFEEDQGSIDTKRSFVTDSGLETISNSIKSITSSGHYRSDHCIKLTVHGIAGPGQPGPEIQEELVQVLKKRLDDTTLDVISLMLARNPMLKLTPDDVQFIQPPMKEPTDTILCTIPHSAIQYLFSINYYLRQNLRQFLNPPKYIDARAENHFKAKCEKHEHFAITHTDSNIFLYNRPHESGRLGIACISLCIVDKRGFPVKMTFTRPSSVTYVDPIQEADFVDCTRSGRYSQDSDNPDPAALIEFAIWERGDVDLQHLSDRLIKAVRHTMCDIVMEFRILTAPIGVYTRGADDVKIESEVKARSNSDVYPVVPTERVVLSGSTSPRATPNQSAKLLVYTEKEQGMSGSSSQVSSPKALSPASIKSKLTWQVHELERRHDEMARQKQKEAAIGLLGTMHRIFSRVCLPWMEFEHNLGTPSVQKMTAELFSRFSIEPVLRELLAKIPSLCADFTTKLYKQEGQEYKLCDLTKATTGKPLPGATQNFFVIARNVQHWESSLNYPSSEDVNRLSSTDNPVTRKSLQQFPPWVMNPKSAATASTEKDQENILDPVLSGMIGLSKFLVPRQHLLLIFISDRQITFLMYNISGELQSSLENLFKGVVNWQNSRSDLLDCILSQKMGLFQNCNKVTWSLEEIDNLIKCKVPPSKEIRRSGIRKPTRQLHPGLPPFEETLRNRKIWKPIQHCSYGVLKDPVLKHGKQILDICLLSKKEAEVQAKLENLYIMWQKKKRGSYVRHPISIETLELLKQSSQVVHYCATPLLFSPNWRQQIAMDSMLDEDVYSTMTAEPWLMDIRLSFVQQYVQFLKTLQFSPVEITLSSPHPSKRIGQSKNGKQEGVSNRKLSTTSSGCHLQLTVPGGIILIEIAFQHAYFCVKLYAFESSKVPAGKAVNSQLSMLFTDECDKFKDQIHLHSFAYDFHLRTIQTYLGAPEMGFKPRYHVTNFLADLVKYYSPSPNFRRNHIHTESQSFLSHNTTASQLYDYLMNNKPPHMKQLSMAQFSSGVDASDKELERALYQIYPLSGYFKDAFGNRVYDDFDVSLVLTWDKDEHKPHTRPNSTLLSGEPEATGSSLATDARNPNLMMLKFYVIVTSRKDIFPRRTIKSWYSKISPLEQPYKDNSHGFQLLNTEAQNAKEKIVNMVKQAADDCRRDTLWQQLLIWVTEEELTEKKKKKKDAPAREESKETNPLTYPEFKVLLDHVHHIPFSEFDQQIIPLLNSSITWYEGLLQYLRTKFVTASRYLTSEDGQIKHLALLNPSHLDMMVLLTVDQQTNSFELEAIFKKSVSQLHAAAHSQEYTAAQELFTQRHVENIVNAVSCYLWTTLL